MKIFVTGGAGFVGKHLIRSLIDKNYKVTIFDNFSNSSRKSISNFSNIEIIEGDITNKQEISSAIKNHDIIIHLAAKINVEESVKNPDITFTTNVLGTENVLNECINKKIKKFFAISSAAVYGNCLESEKVLSENDQTNPISPYGESKMIMENKIKEISQKHNFNSMIFRLFNIYGKGQSKEYAGVITKFSEMIQNNESPLIFGDGKQSRDFISIHDVVDLLTNMISLDVVRNGEIYNIASGRSISIEELAKLMIRLSGKKLAISFQEEKSWDIRYSKASIEKAKNELGFKPKINLEEGLAELISQNKV